MQSKQKQVAISLGLSIRYARRKAKKTQYVLSEELLAGKNYIGDIETGVALPSIIRLQEISIACNTTMSQIMFDAKL